MDNGEYFMNHGEDNDNCTMEKAVSFDDVKECILEATITQFILCNISVVIALAVTLYFNNGSLASALDENFNHLYALLLCGFAAITVIRVTLLGKYMDVIIYSVASTVSLMVAYYIWKIQSAPILYAQGFLWFGLKLLGVYVVLRVILEVADILYLTVLCAVEDIHNQDI